MIARRLHGAFALYLCIAVSTFCHAQANELSLTLGAMTTSDQSVTLPPLPVPCPITVSPNCTQLTTSTSTGFAIEGAFTRQLFGLDVFSVDLELPLVDVPSRDITVTSPILTVPITASVSSFFFTPSVRIKLLRKASISPFFSVGGGLAHFGTSASVPGITSFSNGTTNGALQFGGGLDFKTRLPLLRIRAQARDFYAQSPLHSASSILLVTPGHQNNVFFGAGVVLAF